MGTSSDARCTPQSTHGKAGRSKKSVGVVIGFKKVFKNYFESAKECTIPDELAKASEEEREQYLRFRDSPLKTQRFSDTFVFYSPLLNQFGNLSVTPVHQILGACSVAMLTSLAAELPVRGAITIGSGIEIEDQNLYGPALAQAHHYESKIADYPRVVLAPAVKAYLDDMEANRSAGTFESRMSNLATECKCYLAKDLDQQLIVDYMGKYMNQLLSGNPVLRDAVHKSYAFVTSSEQHFRSNGPEQLARRYALLESYMSPRMESWKDIAG